MAIGKADVGGGVAVFVAPREADGSRPESGTKSTPQLPSRLWAIFLGCGAVATVAYQLTPAGIGQDLIYQVIGLTGAWAILVGVRRYCPARALPWYLMAAGQALWSLADAVFSWDATIQGNDRFPSPADPLYLLGYPVVALGLYLLIRGRRPRRDVAGWLDSAIVTVALALLSWVFLARPTLTNYQESPLAAAVAVAYPIGDILIVGLAIRLITTPGGRTASFRLLLAAIAALLTVDTLASSLDLLTFESTATINFLWLASYVCWGAAALHPTMHDLSRPTTTIDNEFTRKRLLALTLAVLVAPGTLAAEQTFSDRLDVWAVVIGSVVMFLLVVSRMYLAIDQIAAANRERARAQQALAHQATHDSLTGLPNRAQALRLIKGALGRASRTGSPVGLLFIDLDGFKQINDSLGHQAGDEVLRCLAQRMQTNVRSGDIVARLGGDEFVVLLEPLDEETSAVSVADRLIESVSLPLILPQGREVAVGASIGVAFSRPGVADPEALLDEADIAVYRAKQAGRGRTEIFNNSIRREIVSRAELEADLRAAIAREELVLHYQPIVHLVSGEVQGYEALVRWNRPGTGLSHPGDFIPIAEQSDLICDLDRWALFTAARQMRRWYDRTGCDDLIISLNVSPRHIAQSRVVADVADALKAAGIGAHQLALEITETALIEEPAALRHLHQLRRLGVAISIDDFGTGHSSLARIEHLPVDILKIDRAFLDPTSRSAEALLKLIVDTAHALGLEVIAEGIENERQLEMLKSINCASGQGYVLGRPADQSAIDPRPGALHQPLVRPTRRSGQ